jgi:NADPH:quinone reductase-like Zn-dependent oxidoreductase
VTAPDKSAAVLELGAERTLGRDCRLVEALGRDSIDVIVDLVAGPKWPELLDVLRPQGRYAVAGAIGGPIVELDVRTLYLKDLSFFGCTVLEPDVFFNLIKHIERGNVVPLVAERFPLEQIADAQNAFMSKKYIGKIVLTVSDQL